MSVAAQLCPSLGSSTSKTGLFTSHFKTHLCYMWLSELVVPTRGVEGRIGSLLEEAMVVSPTPSTTVATRLLYYSYIAVGSSRLAKAHCPWLVSTALPKELLRTRDNKPDESAAMAEVSKMAKSGSLPMACVDDVAALLHGLVGVCKNAVKSRNSSLALTPDSEWIVGNRGSGEGNYLFGGSWLSSGKGFTKDKKQVSARASRCVCELWRADADICRVPLLP